MHTKRAIPEEEVVVWYRVLFISGPLTGEHKWFPGPLEPFFQVQSQSGGILSSQYKLERVLHKEGWRSWVSYEYHFPSR